MFAGFSIGGIDWLWPDLADAQDQEAKVERIAKIGFEDTRLTHSMGGNIIRIFFQSWSHIVAVFGRSARYVRTKPALRAALVPSAGGREACCLR